MEHSAKRFVEEIFARAEEFCTPGPVFSHEVKKYEDRNLP